MDRVIGFFGGDSQVGTGMLSRSTAEVLSERGKKVLLIEGSGKLDGTARHYKNIGIDNLKASINSGSLREFDVKSNLINRNGISVLVGVSNQLNAGYFPENTFETILGTIEEHYDFIIIDGGDNVNLAMNISALNTAHRRFFIITQRENTIMRFNHVKKEVLDHLAIDGRVIVNKFVKSQSLYGKKEIMKLCDTENILIVPYVEYGWEAETENKTLLNFKPFRKAIEHIADSLMPEEGCKKNGKGILSGKIFKQ